MLRKLWRRFGLWRCWYFRQPSTYTPLFVLTTYRCGSNLLIDYLNCICGVRCYPELLSSNISIGPIRPFLSTNEAVSHLQLSLHALQSPVRGCKLMLDQLEACDVAIETLRESFPGSRFIILYRQSIAEQFVSLRIAQATKQWFVRRHKPVKRVAISLDECEMRKFCEQVRERYKNVFDCAWLRACSTVVSYEELVADPKKILQEYVCPLIERPITDPVSSMQKQNSLPLSERVLNYDTMANLFDAEWSHHKYSWQ